MPECRCGDQFESEDQFHDHLADDHDLFTLVTEAMKR